MLSLRIKRSFFEKRHLCLWVFSGLSFQIFGGWALNTCNNLRFLPINWNVFKILSWLILILKALRPNWWLLLNYGRAVLDYVAVVMQDSPILLDLYQILRVFCPVLSVFREHWLWRPSRLSRTVVTLVKRRLFKLRVSVSVWLNAFAIISSIGYIDQVLGLFFVVGAGIKLMPSILSDANFLRIDATGALWTRTAVLLQVY